MAVSLPSDLIADVMRQADPARRAAATARLQGTGEEPQDFARLVAPQPTSPSAGFAGAMFTGDVERADRSGQAYASFERMVLRNLFEELLPKAESGLFGGGPSAGVWRSLAADQLAGVHVEAGGIGIASSLARAAQHAGPDANAQWPYFSLPPISTFTSTLDEPA